MASIFSGMLRSQLDQEEVIVGEDFGFVHGRWLVVEEYIIFFPRARLSYLQYYTMIDQDTCLDKDTYSVSFSRVFST